jgi:hypothetical protein
LDKRVPVVEVTSAAAKSVRRSHTVIRRATHSDWVHELSSEGQGVRSCRVDRVEINISCYDQSLEGTLSVNDDGRWGSRGVESVCLNVPRPNFNVLPGIWACAAEISWGDGDGVWFQWSLNTSNPSLEGIGTSTVWSKLVLSNTNTVEDNDGIVLSDGRIAPRIVENDV